MPTEHFKSAEAYRKWNAYRHMHGIPAKHLHDVVVAGKKHKVNHEGSKVKRGRKVVTVGASGRTAKYTGARGRKRHAAKKR